MQVDARTRFTKLSIGLWPFGSSFKVALKALTPIRAGNIKVNDDVVLRDLYIVQLFCIDPGQSGFDILPLLHGSAIFVRILRQAVLANIIKERMLLLQFDPGGGRGVISRIIPGGRVFQKFFEFFVLEAAVVAAHPFAVHILGTFFVIREIVHQFFTERSPGVRIRNLCLLIVGVVHCPGTFQRYAIFFFEDVVGVQHEVVEVVGCTKHSCRNIIVVTMLVFLVDVFAIPCNSTQFKVNLAYEVAVFLCRYFFAARLHIDQSPNQTRFCIRDLYGLVCTEKHEALELACVGTSELLVHHHGLVGNQRV